MKKQVIFIAMLCCLFLCGCTHKTPQAEEKHEMQTMDLSALPEGQIVAYTVADEGAYYIVAQQYDGMYRQYEFYKQSFESQELEFLAKRDLVDERRFVVHAKMENGKLIWYWVDESQDTLYKCSLEESFIEEEALEGNAWDRVKYEMSKEAEKFADWEQEVPGEYLTGQVFLIGKNDSYTVFQQLIEYPYDEVKTKDKYINVYDRKSDEVRQLCMAEYGSEFHLAFSGNYLMFGSRNAPHDFDAHDDYYDDIYLVRLDTMEVNNITKDLGKERAMTSLWFDGPWADGNYLYIISRDEAESEYQALYYLRTN